MTVKKYTPGRKRTFEKKDKPSADKKRTFEKRERTSSDKRKTFDKRESTSDDKKRTFEKRERTSSDKRKTFDKRDKYTKPLRRKSTTSSTREYSDDQRLNKYIANMGICSRRQADELIKTGLITVNGQVITQMGTKVKSSDDVRYNGQRLKNRKMVYILLNKPKDFVTTTKDPHAKNTVMDLIKCDERIYPVGRLDKNTTGVLLLTNDGDLTKKLTHPGNQKAKIYFVTLDKALTRSDMNLLMKGIELEDGFIKPDEISYADPKSKNLIGIELHSGKNRIVRRMFEHLDYKVRKLDRVYFAGLTKKGLTRGQWRHLTEKEVGILKMGSFR